MQKGSCLSQPRMNMKKAKLSHSVGSSHSIESPLVRSIILVHVTHCTAGMTIIMNTIAKISNTFLIHFLSSSIGMSNNIACLFSWPTAHDAHEDEACDCCSENYCNDCSHHHMYLEVSTVAGGSWKSCCDRTAMHNEWMKIFAIATEIKCYSFV